ncbi:MAG: carboxypeptidase M32 [Actinomycetota bacterium]|nr:carboxypeptidase M32 [Actinomycetota bacterium]
MEASLADLKQRLAEIDDLQRTQLLLEWDTEVWMPPSGESSRAAHLTTLETIVHERQIDDRIGELLDDVEPYAASLPGDADDACLIRAARRLWEKKRRIPTDLAAEIAGAQVESYQAWVKAREEENFAGFRPSLERMLELQRRWIECFVPYDDPYDVVLDNFEGGTKTEDVRRIFAALQPEITALVAEHANEADEDEFLRGPFPIAPQEALSRELIERFGASWDAFRIDLAVHPFAAAVGLRDIRLTTRYETSDLSSLFTAMHECGHGLYEWGSAPSLERTPLQGGEASSALHESQSRLWENVVGRSLPFWRWFYPRVQEAFPDILADVSLERFHRAVNRPHRSFIRVDADETSYGLHVILRFELEQELLSGRLAVKDLPDAWNARFRELIGLEVPNDTVGVLQDTHWASGLFGYFPTYLLGSVLSVQIWGKAREALPEVEQQIERGEFTELHTWLRENLYSLGSKFSPPETIERVVGGPIDPQPYLRYLRGKLTALAAS